MLFSLVTKKNNKIDVFGMILPDPPAQRAAFRAQLHSKLGANNERTIPDSSYNCHGLTFVSKAGHIGSGTIGEWKLSLPGTDDYTHYNSNFTTAQKDIETLLSDSGMRMKASVANLELDKFQKADNIMTGDVVIYYKYENGKKTITHTGIVYKVTKLRDDCVTIKVWSKIGVDQGEYFHSVNNPFIMEMYGIIAEIWSDTKI